MDTPIFMTCRVSPCPVTFQTMAKFPDQAVSGRHTCADEINKKTMPLQSGRCTEGSSKKKAGDSGKFPDTVCEWRDKTDFFLKTLYFLFLSLSLLSLPPQTSPCTTSIPRLLCSIGMCPDFCTAQHPAQKGLCGYVG